MRTVNPKRAGMTLAVTLSAVYLACAFVLMRLPRSTAIAISNGILHGIDVTSIFSQTMTWPDMIGGLLTVFIISWLVGSTMASVYNLTGEFLAEEDEPQVNIPLKRKRREPI